MVTVAPEYAYGEVGVPVQSNTGMNVPPNSTIQYSVELIRFDTGDNG